jgi:hypothetical protein
MTSINTALVNKLFILAQVKEFDPWFHFISEVRHIDHARNCLCEIFLQTNCDYLWMIDDDVDVPPTAMNMTLEGKDIISGLVFCWIKGELLPSTWERSECEQCVCVSKYLADGTVHDPTQYSVLNNGLCRWNPLRELYEAFCDPKTGILSGMKCRCKNTGLDPFVFRAHKGVIGEPKLLEVDSVGAACLMISRHVIEQMQRPWFRFLYKPSREILLTEDHYFSWKAKEMGFSVWADTRVGCSHFKLVNLLDINSAINRGYIKGKEAATQTIGFPVFDPKTAVVDEVVIGEPKRPGAMTAGIVAGSKVG